MDGAGPARLTDVLSQLPPPPAFSALNPPPPISRPPASRIGCAPALTTSAPSLTFSRSALNAAAVVAASAAAPAAAAAAALLASTTATLADAAAASPSAEHAAKAAARAAADLADDADVAAGGDGAVLATCSDPEAAMEAPFVSTMASRRETEEPPPLIRPSSPMMHRMTAAGTELPLA